MSAISLVESAPLEARLTALTAAVEKMAESLANASPDVPAWLPRKKLAAHFGMSPSAAAPYITSAISAGRLDNFQPADYLGRRGHTLYKVADFEAYLRRLDSSTINP